MFKNKLIKKFSERHFKSKNQHFFATHAESFEVFIMSFFNNMNQLIADNNYEKKNR